MRNVVIHDMRDYVKIHWKLILVSVIAAFSCFGFFFRDSAIGLRTSVLPDGILFFTVFLLGANLLTFGIHHFAEKKDKYPYWVFLLLYTTSNIWSYQICFTLQQVAVALAMCLSGLAAILSMKACFLEKGMKSGIELLAAMLLMVPVLCVNRVLAVYYAAISIGYFLILLEREDLKEKRMLRGSLGWLIPFAVQYLMSGVLKEIWQIETADYMGNQLAWGRLKTAECWRNILDVVVQLMVADTSENFSFYAAGGGLAIVAVIMLARRKRAEDGIWKGLRYGVLWIALSVMLLLPVFMSICTGKMLLTKSQFALPVVAAFLGTYGMGTMQELWNTETDEVKRCSKERMLEVFHLCASIAIIMQMVYNLRGH